MLVWYKTRLDRIKSSYVIIKKLYVHKTLYILFLFGRVTWKCYEIVISSITSNIYDIQWDSLTQSDIIRSTALFLRMFAFSSALFYLFLFMCAIVYLSLRLHVHSMLLNTSWSSYLLFLCLSFFAFLSSSYTLCPFLYNTIRYSPCLVPPLAFSFYLFLFLCLSVFMPDCSSVRLAIWPVVPSLFNHFCVHSSHCSSACDWNSQSCATFKKNSNLAFTPLPRLPKSI